MKTRLRKIVVRQQRYLWTVRASSGRYPAELRVWGNGKNSPPLIAHLPQYPPPSEVRQLIEHGLDHGWQPDGDGTGLDIGAWTYRPVGPVGDAGVQPHLLVATAVYAG